MAKEVFITQWFSDEMRLAGESLIKKLQQSGAQVASAFWLLHPEEKTWELNIVSPLVKSEGPKAYYKRIDDIQNSAKSEEHIISLHDIRVSNTNHPITKAFRSSVLYQASLGNNRLGRQRIGDVYVEDMYLYSLDWNLLDKPLVAG